MTKAEQQPAERQLGMRWRKAEVIAKAFAGVGIPLVLAWLAVVQQRSESAAANERARSADAQRQADRIVALQSSLASSNERERSIALLTVDVLSRTGSIPEEFQDAIRAIALLDEGPVQVQAQQLLRSDLARSLEASAAPDSASAFSTGGAAEAVPLASRRPAIDSAVAQIATPASLTRLQARTVLWVDDRPANNTVLRSTFRGLGLAVVTATSTDAALRELEMRSYDLVISDMARPSDPLAGYTLLDEIRKVGLRAPFVIYAVSRDLERHNSEAQERGAVGQASTPEGLLRLVQSALDLRGSAS